MRGAGRPSPKPAGLDRRAPKSPTAPGHAQDRDHAVLLGSVSDHDTGNPISGASVTLVQVDAGADRAGPQFTGEEGRFVFGQVTPGTYVLRTTMLGYQPRQDTLALEEATEVRVAVELAVSPVELDPINVEVSRPSQTFEARRARLHGAFFDREGIEDRFASKISDVFMGIPNLSLVEGRPNNLRGGGGQFSAGRCRMGVYVDGVLTDVPVDDAVPPDAIETMEVHTSLGEVPVQYRRNACGVVLIRLRLGRCA